MNRKGTLLLTRNDVSGLLGIRECVTAVERVFKMHGEGKTAPPGVLGVHATDGGFHIKAGLLDLNRSYFAAKINANFPANPQLRSLPTIQGLVVLCDAKNGMLLAVMDSIEITTQRTGAATAVAAKYLAKADSKTVTICGCGNQGRISAEALASVLSIERMFAWDVSTDRSETFASEVSSRLTLEVVAVRDLESAVSQSDIVVTCTPAKEPFLQRRFVKPGTFIAAVGADSEEKQELESGLLAENKVVADLLDQSATIGEIHHAVRHELMTRADVHGELGEVIAGVKAGRTSEDEIIIFDSTGMALQDVITATIIYEKAVKNRVGNMMAFG